MREWYSASDLAGLPGMPGTDRSVRSRAERDDWQSRQRKALGGGREFHITSLPELTRQYLAARSISALDTTASAAGAAEGRRLQIGSAIETASHQAVRERGLTTVAALPSRARARMDARLAVLAALDAFSTRSHLGPSKAVHGFCARYNEGEIAVEPWVRELIADVHPATLYRWRQRLQGEGAAALSGRYKGQRGRSKIDTHPELREFILGMLKDYPHAGAKHVLRGLRARFDAELLPSYRRLQAWLSDWKRRHPQLFTAVSDPDAWRSHFKAAGGSASEAVLRLNHVWEFDSTPTDLLLSDNARHAIIGVIDVYTRRLKLHVARTSRASAIASLTRRAISDWGVPEVAKTDNGADYVSRHLTRVFQGLGIEQKLCPPFTPEAKPHIERAFHTFAHDLVELLGGFIGHNVAERKAIEARRSFAERLMKRGGEAEAVALRLSPEELQRFCDQWCEQVYGIEPHGALGGRSPLEMAAAWDGPVRHLSDERALDVLLLEAPGDGGWRVVGKKGLRIQGGWYDHAELGGREGNRVHVLLDEAEYGYVYVFDEDGGFICRAEDPTRTGISRAEVAAQRKARQREVLLAGKRAMADAAKAARTGNIVQEILAERARAAGKLTMFPRPSEPHTTPALQAAAEAARAHETPRQQLTDAQRAERERLAEEMARPAKVEALRPEATPRQMFQHWVRIDRRISAGETVDDSDRKFHTAFRQTYDFKVESEIHEDFGLDVDGLAVGSKKESPLESGLSRL